MDPIIRVQHLTKRYKKSAAPAVDDISFEVGQGELFAFLGPNGAGQQPRSRSSRRRWPRPAAPSSSPATTSTATRRPSASSIGIIFQNLSVDAHLSAEENIRLHVALYGIYGYRPFYRMMPAAYRARVEQLAQVVGLEENLSSRCSRLRTWSRKSLYAGGGPSKIRIAPTCMCAFELSFVRNDASIEVSLSICPCAIATQA